MRLTGLTENPSGACFTYEAHTTLPAEEILERRAKAKDAADHQRTKTLSTVGEIHDFLLREENCVPIVVGSLLFYLKKTDFEAYDSAVRRFSFYPLTFE